MRAINRLLPFRRQLLSIIHHPSSIIHYPSPITPRTELIDPMALLRTTSRRNRLLPLARKNVLTFLLCYRSLSHNSTTTHALNLALISGTTRTSGPPRPILGPRVTTYISTLLQERGNQVTIIDPNDFDLLQKPHFAYAKSQVPDNLQKVHDILDAADGYVCVTPEYNHAPSPALVNVLNHFGSSTFSFKPSAIVSYSAGQWGGTRAAIGLRPILSELGCLPVSAMIHIPKAQEVLDENGVPINSHDSQQQWETYCGRCFSQIEWWGTAAKEHRLRADPFDESPALRKDPKERNAP